MREVDVMVSCDAGGDFFSSSSWHNMQHTGRVFETLFCRSDRERVDWGVTGTRCILGRLHTRVNIRLLQKAELCHSGGGGGGRFGCVQRKKRHLCFTKENPKLRANESSISFPVRHVFVRPKLSKLRQGTEMMKVELSPAQSHKVSLFSCHVTQANVDQR